MIRALKVPACTTAAIVLLHATDMSPLWFIGPYRRWFSEIVLSSEVNIAWFLLAILISLAILAVYTPRNELHAAS